MSEQSWCPARGRGAVSLVILFFLGLQTLTSLRLVCPPRTIAALAPFRLLCAPTLWPFLDYGMYMDPHYRGETLPRLVLIGVGPDKSETVLTPAALGLDRWLFADFTVALLDGRTDEARRFLELFERRQRQRPKSIRIENAPLELTDSGFVSRNRRVIKEVRWSD